MVLWGVFRVFWRKNDKSVELFPCFSQSFFCHSGGISIIIAGTGSVSGIMGKSNRDPSFVRMTRTLSYFPAFGVRSFVIPQESQLRHHCRHRKHLRYMGKSNRDPSFVRMTKALSYFPAFRNRSLSFAGVSIIIAGTGSISGIWAKAIEILPSFRMTRALSYFPASRNRSLSFRRNVNHIVIAGTGSVSGIIYKSNREILPSSG